MFQGLSTALTALYADQTALETTGNNIANVNTDGYTRQRVDLSPTGGSVPSFWSQGSQVGTGVNVQDVARLRDAFLDTRVLQEQGTQGQLDRSQSTMASVEQTFAEPSDSGLQSQLSDFWSSWDDVAANPGGTTSTASREQTIGKAQTLVTGFQSASSELTALKTSSLSSLKDDVGQINSMAKSIASLNNSIAASTNSGGTPNDLLDQRDLLVKKIASLANVTTQPTQSGEIAVNLGGVALVRDTTVTSLQVDASGSPVVLRWDADGNAATVTDGVAANITGGDVGGLMTTVNTTIPKYQSMLDTVAQKLISTVNTQHASGLDQNGNAGGVFFTGTGAANLAVSSALVADPTLLAAAAPGVNTGPGDGENARAMATLTSSATGPDAAYTTLIDNLGVEAQSANRQVTIQTSITNSVNAAQQSESGVNLDEEMTNMVKFQKSYNASAKYLSVMSDMLDTLISIVR